MDKKNETKPVVDKTPLTNKEKNELLKKVEALFKAMPTMSIDNILPPRGAALWKRWVLSNRV